MLRNTVCMVVFVAALTFGTASAQTYISFDVPGSTFTSAMDINNGGAVVGFYTDSAGKTHGFLLKEGNFTTIDYPGAVRTAAMGINSQGDIVGVHYEDPTRIPNSIGAHGYLLQQGVFTPVDYPGKYGALPVRINDAGQIVGCNHDDDGPGGYMMADMHGFLFSNGSYTQLSMPDTMNYGVNADGSITAGMTQEGTDPASAFHGYIASNDVVVRFDFPFSISTQVYDMSPTGDMLLGRYTDATKKAHGFLMWLGDSIATFGLDPQGGLPGPFEFVAIDYPGASATNASGFNSRGDVVGNYVDAAGKTHGFFVHLGPARQGEQRTEVQ